MSEGGGDIIIKSGSVVIDFDDALYPKRNGDPKKHENARIVRSLGSRSSKSTTAKKR